jgi:hypothetical protein
MKDFQIFNINISVATVKAKNATEALVIYCTSKYIFDTGNYRAVETNKAIF